MAAQLTSKLNLWRNSATLIIASGLKGMRSTVNGSVSKSMVPGCKSEEQQLEILLLKRSGRSQSFASMYVFPGGVIDNSDFADAWVDLFSKTGFDLRDPNIRKSTQSSKRMTLYEQRPAECEKIIPSEVAYRICAIRETFEESGILLANSIKSANNPASPVFDAQRKLIFPKKRLVHVYEHESPKVLDEWRNKVHKNGHEFIKMCNELHVVPDVFGLAEWSNWLTPLLESKRRFDTAFYVCCTDKDVDAVEDHKETTHLQWYSPDKAIRLALNGSLNFAPPQMYEVARLRQFRTLQELHTFSIERSSRGSSRWFPIRIELDDGALHVLPGDDLYPTKPDFEGTGPQPLVMKGSIKELRSLGNNFNRMEFPKGIKRLIDGEFVVNIDIPDGHVRPKFPTVRNKTEAKL